MATGGIHLVGRQTELARIAAALDAARAGDAAFILVLGEAGIGKTAFLRAAGWLAEARGLRSLVGTAIASGSSIPYLPLAGPLREALRMTAETDRAASIVRRALEGDAAPAARRDAARAARLVEAIRDVLVNQPTLLLVDDVHWADAATLTVLEYLAVRAQDDRLAVVAAARDDEPQALRRLPIADGRRYLQLQLPRLSRDAVHQQVASLVGRSAPVGMVDELYRRSAGNPLHVEELMSEQGASPGDAAAGRSLRALVRARLDRLAPETRRIAEALAVIGRPTELPLVAQVAGLDAEATGVALAEAERGGAVVRRADGRALRHPLFGEVMTAELAGTPMAAAMHRRSAEALEAIGAPAAELAGHWAAAGDRERTWAASFVAGEQAEAASAFAEAKLHFERAAEHWPPDHDGRASALLRAADAAWMTGDPRAAVEIARAAQRDDAPGLESQIALAQYLWDAGERSEATKAFARAAEHLRHDSSPTARAAALWGLGRARVGEGQPDDAHRLAVAAAAVAEEAGDATWLSHAWVLAGMSRAWMGDITGVDDLERGLAAAIASGDPEAIGHAYQFLVEQLWLAGRLGEARRVGVEGIPACERVGLARSHGADTRGRTALVLLDLGEWTEADAVLEGADSRAYPAVARAMLALRRGEWTTAERELDASTSGGAIGGRGRLGGLTELARVELVWLQGDEDAARRELEAVPGQPGVWGIDIEVRRALWRSRLYRDDGQEVRHFDVSLTAAVEAERRARRDGNADAWHACVAAWAAAGRPYEQAIALLAAAETSYAARDRAGGRAHLLAGRALANGLGALPLVSHADALARRARVTLTPETRRRADPSRLTGRELEVLSLLAEGLTNPQIAQRLFLSPKTVGIHVSRILEKLDAHTRGEAVATGRRRRLLP